MMGSKLYITSSRTFYRIRFFIPFIGIPAIISIVRSKKHIQRRRYAICPCTIYIPYEQ